MVSIPDNRLKSFYDREYLKKNYSNITTADEHPYCSLVKYFIDDYKMDISKVDEFNHTYLMHAFTHTCSDIKLIKYLVEDKK